MIKSMTGFGKGEAVSKKFGRFFIEVRTINHRYLDMSIKMPNGLSILEDRIKRYVQTYIKRGKVHISIGQHKDSDDKAYIDILKVKKYYKILQTIKRTFKLKDDITLNNLLSFPEVISYGEAHFEADLIWPILKEAIKKAVLDCNKMRVREGKILYNDLMKRREDISRFIEEISGFIPRRNYEYKQKLNSHLKDILKSQEYAIDTPRLEVELAIFIRQYDISEEITRTDAHLIAFKENAIGEDDEVGKKLDFILQELQREVNTLGAKANYENISNRVVDIKTEIEKMREQVQNVE